MRHKTLSRIVSLIGLTLLVAAILTAGCQPQTVLPEKRQETRETLSEEPVGEKEALPLPTSLPPNETKTGSNPDAPPLASPYRINRMIIKNAELKLLMEDVGTGVDLTTQVAADTFGYILSSRTWYQKGFQYATLTIGVPVDQFENAIRRLRGMAIRVQDETASGTDVTDQYVDLESRLRNLEATEVRIRSFLEQAQTVEESLRINGQLTEITAQIEEVKGQMSYLKDRAAYSTITVHLQPQMPEPTPVPEPTPEPDIWRPGKTFQRASSVLGSILRVIGDATIWIAVVLGPFAIPATLALWVAIRASKRQASKN